MNPNILSLTLWLLIIVLLLLIVKLLSNAKTSRALGERVGSIYKPQLQIRDSIQKYCTACGCSGFAVFRQEGATWVEVLLWLTFIVPGIIYSIWRGSTRRWVCPMCGNSSMIPLDSPRAKAALEAKQ